MTTTKLSLLFIIGSLLMLIICFTYHNDYIPPERFINEWEIVNSPIMFWENGCPMSEAQTENVLVSTAYLLQRENKISENIVNKTKFLRGKNGELLPGRKVIYKNGKYILTY